ncbi:MAG: tRNA (guanosine(46)-N7)-methyltransferase TrmB, partial [Microbacterium sp.]
MTDPAAPAETPRTFRDRPVSFVRRSGRMSEAQERAWAELSTQYVIESPRDTASTSIRPGSAIDPAEVWRRRAPLVV